MASIHFLKAIEMGIDTHQEPVVYMREDCHICRAEGFNSNTRLLIKTDTGALITTLNVVKSDKLQHGQIGFSKIAQQRLQVSQGQPVSVGHAPLVESLSAVRKKIYGHALSDSEIHSIVIDISKHKYTDIEIASFLSICAGGRLNTDEIIGLTRAMVDSGKHLNWPGSERVFDKHCIGGLPGNRTTPLIVAIVSAAGLTIPKTSSRAITSPSGTADTMEALTRVNLKLTKIQQVVEDTGACLAWGGAVNLSPADDLLIRIERALDLDGEGQLIASVLSKKIAAGSTHTIIDIPVGDTAKVRTQADADRLAGLFTQVGNACGIHVRCIITDGSKPIGSGIGPVEEARDLLAVFQCLSHAPQDLRARALMLAAHLLDLARQCGMENALQQATELLDSGRAWAQFQRIVEAQGGLKSLPDARFQIEEKATCSGVIQAIDNRKLSRLAKLAGAPIDITAGLRLHANIGSRLSAGDPLFTLYSESSGESDYALAYYHDNPDIFEIGEL